MQPSFRIENIELTGAEDRLTMDVTGDGDGVQIDICIDGTIRKSVIIAAENDTVMLMTRVHGKRELETNQDLLAEWLKEDDDGKNSAV